MSSYFILESLKVFFFLYYSLNFYYFTLFWCFSSGIESCENLFFFLFSILIPLLFFTFLCIVILFLCLLFSILFIKFVLKSVLTWACNNLVFCLIWCFCLLLLLSPGKLTLILFLYYFVNFIFNFCIFYLRSLLVSSCACLKGYVLFSSSLWLIFPKAYL